MRPPPGAHDSRGGTTATAAAPPAPAAGLPWPTVLRALREARGDTQEGWAARLGVSRKTVQRWEAGERSPDPGAEGVLLNYCREAGLLRAFAHGPLAGLTLTEAGLRDLLAEARWRGPAPAAGPAPHSPDGLAGQTTAPEAMPGHAPESPSAPQPGTAAGSAEAPASEPPHTPPEPPTNLPAALTSFVGREQELAAVRRIQAGTRLLTLTGPGGGGKTRLALALAAELRWAYPDGVWFADLAPLAEPALVAEVVAAALEVRTMGQQPPAAALREALRARRLLLLLDNCEHLLPAGADLAEALLRACPHLEVVATSREPLGIAGETVWRVPPLTFPAAAHEAGTAGGAPPVPGPAAALGTTDAERLFVARARLRRPEFAPTPEDAAAVAEICRRLDGMPLALELAAARVGVLSVGQIAARLTDRFRLLTGGSRAAPTRQLTLRAAMDWSHDLLTEPERGALRALSVFAGDFTLEAAEAVCAAGADEEPAPPALLALSGAEGSGAEGSGAEGSHARGRRTEDERGAGAGIRPPSVVVRQDDVLDLLARLVDKSLVLADERSGEAGAAVRYRLLETVRQYAAGHLAQAGEASAARDRHAGHYLELAEQAAPLVQGRDQAYWHALLDTEHDNLRAAVAWTVQRGDADRALRLAAALRWFWYRRRHWDEGFTWPARALSLPGAQGPALAPLRARVLEGAGLFAMWRDPDAAQALWQECIAINRELGLLDRVAQTQVFLAWLFIRLWRLDDANVQAEAALTLAEAAGGGRRATALALLAAVAARRGDHAAARVRYEEALALRRTDDDVSVRSLLLLDMAKAAFLAGDMAEARARAEAALDIAREAGMRQGVEEELRLIARVALAQGDVTTAEAQATELLTHARGRGAGAEADAVALLGQVAHTAGDPVGAAARYRQTLELAQQLPDPGEMHPVLYRDVGDQPGVALALEGTAGLCAPTTPTAALRLAGAAAALRDRARQPLAEAERTALDRALAPARGDLGPDAAQQAWASGHASPIEDALALALEALAVDRKRDRREVIQAL